MINKITIIGIGLIGGSLARALKEKNLAKVVFGYGRDHSRLEGAQKSNVIDDFSTSIKEAIVGADIIVIATPVGTFKKILEEIEPIVSSNVIITDVGSTKTDIVNSVNDVLRAKSSCFIPAHPIAGKEKSGFEVSDAKLFEGKKVIITPQENNLSESIKTIEKMWKSVGAEVDFMSSESVSYTHLTMPTKRIV